MHKLLIIIAILSACTLQTPQPATARLEGDRVIVAMSDGKTCQHFWAEGKGRMEPCKVDWAYADGVVALTDDRGQRYALQAAQQ